MALFRFCVRSAALPRYLLYDPVTTPCGHTFCRPCLLRTSDYAAQHLVCPICRSPVSVPTERNTPTNILIDRLIHALFPLAAADRAQSETVERPDSSSGIDTPIFVCTLALPTVICFLHIFQPYHRLMLRRCVDGNKRFGMVLPRFSIRKTIHRRNEFNAISTASRWGLLGRDGPHNIHAIRDDVGDIRPRNIDRWKKSSRGHRPKTVSHF